MNEEFSKEGKNDNKWITVKELGREKETKQGMKKAK